MKSDRYIYSVGTLTTEIRQLLEGGLPLIWLEGEVSNFSSPSSGHWYLNLKDSQAQIQCAMFRNANRLTNFTPKNGTQITARGRLTVYAPRGNYQLILEHIEPSGEGALRRQFEALKKQLEQEGLFSAERKKTIPNQPKSVGLITSPTSAAVRDLIHVLQRRCPSIEITVYPAVVQGDKAVSSISNAIRMANLRNECDVLIVGRGGGSLEDLWAFNEAEVAHAIAESELPIVSAVGHETDTTIADWVADHRAATPSAAAEFVAPDASQWLKQLNLTKTRLQQSLERRLLQNDQAYSNLQRRLLAQHPGKRLASLRQQHSQISSRLKQAVTHQNTRNVQHLNHLQTRLQNTNPANRIKQQQDTVTQLNHQLNSHYKRLLEQKRQQLSELARTLNTVSPLATLDRGYSIALKPKTAEVITNAQQVNTGDVLTIKLHQGELGCQITEINTGK